jgi:thioredoxin reductase (NADPH)
METPIRGIYAAGDVIPKELRQIITATNDGGIAAQAVINFLK